MTPKLQTYCEAWSTALDGISEDQARMVYFQQALPQLLLDRDALMPVIENVASGRRWPAPSGNGLFAHEVLLYLDAKRRFSLRLYFHPAKSHSPIHDHTGWGISGVPFGRLSVVRYALQSPIRSESAKIAEKSRRIFEPGEVESTRPWEAGIHKTGTPDEAVNAMISVYGRPGRRRYINIFNQETGRVERQYPTKILMRKLAAEALDGFKK